LERLLAHHRKLFKLPLQLQQTTEVQPLQVTRLHLPLAVLQALFRKQVQEQLLFRAWPMVLRTLLLLKQQIQLVNLRQAQQVILLRLTQCQVRPRSVRQQLQVTTLQQFLLPLQQAMVGQALQLTQLRPPHLGLLVLLHSLVQEQLRFLDCPEERHIPLQ
jgi:hypothetical protein